MEVFRCHTGNSHTVCLHPLKIQLTEVGAFFETQCTRCSKISRRYCNEFGCLRLTETQCNTLNDGVHIIAEGAIHFPFELLSIPLVNDQKEHFLYLILHFVFLFSISESFLTQYSRQLDWHLQGVLLLKNKRNTLNCCQ